METIAMNRYELEVVIHGIESEEIARNIMDSVVENGAWRIDDANYFPETLKMEFVGKDSARPRETDDQIIDKLAWAIWLKTGIPCKIEVSLTKIDENPCFDFDRGKQDYERVMKAFHVEEEEKPQVIRLMPSATRTPVGAAIQTKEHADEKANETRKWTPVFAQTEAADAEGKPKGTPGGVDEDRQAGDGLQAQP
jgi:hypothetical protein